MRSGGKPMKSAEVEKARSKIDAIDQEIVALIEKRARAVTEIWAIKKKLKWPLIDKAREDEILKGIPQDLKQVFVEVLAYCRRVQ